MSYTIITRLITFATSMKSAGAAGLNTSISNNWTRRSEERRVHPPAPGVGRVINFIFFFFRCTQYEKYTNLLLGNLKLTTIQNTPTHFEKTASWASTGQGTSSARPGSSSRSRSSSSIFIFNTKTSTKSSGDRYHVNGRKETISGNKLNANLIISFLTRKVL